MATTTKSKPAGVFVKKAVRAGVYKQTSLDPVTDKIVTQTVYVSPQFLRKSAFGTMHMIKNGGLTVPVCLDHQDGAVPKPVQVDEWLAEEMRNSVGVLEDVQFNPETQEHEYKFSIKDPIIAEKVRNGIITTVSPNFHNEFSTGNGSRYTNVIAHLALTFRPRDFKQSKEPMREVSAVRASAPDKSGSVRFSVMSAVANTGEFLVPMHQMSFNTLKAMAKRDSTGRVSFESVDYTFKFETLGDFHKWLTRRYQWTLQMSVAGRFGHVLYFAVVHAPVGGITIGGRRYLGGQFIPTTSLESLHPEDRKRVQDASAALRQKRAEAASAHRGADETWQQAIKRHVGEHANRELSTSDRQQTVRRLNALRNHHGDQVAERIAMLAGQDAAKLAGAGDGPNAELLKRRLAAYHAMSGMLGDNDLPKPQEMKQAASEVKGPQTGQPYDKNYRENEDKIREMERGHRNALSEMSDAASDVDTAIKKRMHNEMKQELMDRMKEDWPHLNDEQKAEFEKKIAALPHDALGEPDENGQYPDNPNDYRAANDIISDVNDAAYDAKRENENKAAKEKRIAEHKKDVEEAAKRGLVFERPDDHDNPGDLKVHPEKLDLAKAAVKDYQEQAKKHLEDSKNQLNKKEVARSKRMHKHLSEAAKQMQREIDAHEKAKEAPDQSKSRRESEEKAAKESYDKDVGAGAYDKITGKDRASADALSKGNAVIGESVGHLPLKKAVEEAKRRYPEHTVLHRMGDFYELIGGDAVKAAKDLKLTLTTRDKDYPMAGFPHHALETNLRGLLAKGHKVAIMDGSDAARRAIEEAKQPGEMPDESPFAKEHGSKKSKVEQENEWLNKDAEHRKEFGERADKETDPIKKSVLKAQAFYRPHSDDDFDKIKSEHDSARNDVSEWSKKQNDLYSKMSNLESKYKQDTPAYKKLEEQYRDAKDKSMEAQERFKKTKIYYDDAATAKALHDPKIPDYVKYAHVQQKSWGSENPKLREAILEHAKKDAVASGLPEEAGEHLADEVSRYPRLDDHARSVKYAAGRHENAQRESGLRKDIESLPGYKDLPEHVVYNIQKNAFERHQYDPPKALEKAKEYIDEHRASVEADERYEREKKEQAQKKRDIADAIKSGKITSENIGDAVSHAIRSRHEAHTNFDPSATGKKYKESDYLVDTFKGANGSLTGIGHATIANEGYWTDGRAAVKAPQSLVDHVKSQGWGSTASPAPVRRLISSVKYGAPSKIESYDPSGDGKYFITDGKKHSAVRAEDHHRITSLYPDAVPHMPTVASKPVVYKSGGEIVGIAMPLIKSKSDNVPLDKPDLGEKVDLSSFAEPGKYKPKDMQVINTGTNKLSVRHPDDAGVSLDVHKPSKTSDEWKVDGFHGSYNSKAQAVNAAKEILSYSHGKSGSHETGLQFKPKASNAPSSGDNAAKVSKLKGEIEKIRDKMYERSKRSRGTAGALNRDIQNWQTTLDAKRKELKELEGGVEKFAIVHAPAGGADVDGHHYLGGQFTPNDAQSVTGPAYTEQAKDYSKMQNTTTPEEALSFMSHEPNYAKVKKAYISKNATINPDGSIKSIPINTDDWREYIPGYIGTNAHVVHQAASTANDKLFKEALEAMKGKGNKKVAILGGGGGCHGINTPIMMADGSIKMVQNIKEGDELMGPDSMPRKVLRLIRGNAPLYAVVPTKGQQFTVNGDHILSLHTITRNKVKSRRVDTKVEISVDDVLKRGKRFFDNFFLYRVPVDFNWDAPILDPYFLGLWLGDGTTGSSTITSADNEVKKYLADFVKKFPKLKLRIARKLDNKASTFHLSLRSQVQRGKWGAVKNPLMELMRAIGVLDSKYIPDDYLRNDRSIRLELLAGILDSDGSYSHRGGFDFVTKHRHFAEQVEYLARSLGFSAYAKPCTKSSQFGKKGTYYRMFICGDVNLIPTKIAHKKASPRATRYADGHRARCVLHSGFKIEPIGNGDYFGFTLSGDGLYLLGDFTVTHNSGKGTAVGRHFDQHEYPIRVDQVSGHYDHLMDKIKQIKEAGFEPDIVFVDRSPHEAWQGVVGRAMDSHRKGQPPRTVPYDVAVKANIEARKVALRLAQENPDINLRVIDNNGEGDSRLLEDRTEIIKHLLKADHNPEEEMQKAREHVNKLESIGKLPSHIAAGLRGPRG